MKKISVLFLVLTILISCANGQKKQYNGKVKEMKESKYSASMEFGEPAIEKRMEIRNLEYDISGDVIEFNSYDYEYKMSSTTKSEYNKDNRCIKFCIYYTPGGLSYMAKYEYDTNGNFTRVEESDDTGKITAINKLKYNSSGQIWRNRQK